MLDIPRSLFTGPMNDQDCRRIAAVFGSRVLTRIVCVREGGYTADLYENSHHLKTEQDALQFAESWSRLTIDPRDCRPSTGRIAREPEAQPT